jgi:ubiquinone/menaquinone biosynthesis C-methylase UbiE
MSTQRDTRGDRRVAGYYDRLAPVYGDGVYFATRRAAVLGCVAGEIAAARAVLDLGCGNGAFLAEFVAGDAARRVVGADLSADMLAAARQRVPRSTGVVRADAVALPFRAAAFDLAFMSHVLQLIPDLDACVAEVTRVLQPGGVLVSTAGTGAWREMIRGVIGADQLQEVEALFGAARLRARRDDRNELTAACERAGLEPAWRTAAFSVDWPALEEWVRIRWLSIADAAVRERAERWLAALGARLPARVVEVTETLLIARRR